MDSCRHLDSALLDFPSCPIIWKRKMSRRGIVTAGPQSLPQTLELVGTSNGHSISDHRPRFNIVRNCIDGSLQTRKTLEQTVSRNVLLTDPGRSLPSCSPI